MLYNVIDCLPSNLKYAMDRKGVSVEEIAEKLGVSVKSINNYILGKTLPRMWTLLKLCKELNVTADFMVGRSDVDGNPIL